MEAILLKYGYVVLFLGSAVEGEAFLLAAAVLASRGLLYLPAVMAVAVAANTAADQAYYLLARARGRDWLDRRFGGNARFRRLLALVERHGRWLLLVSRYVFGLRILIPAACGALGMPLRVFLPLGLLAGVLWAVPTALVGYYGGRALESVLSDVRHFELLIALGLLAVPALVLASRAARRLFPRSELRAMDLHALVPLVMGLMGLLNIVSALLPRPAAAVTALETWLPLEVRQHSRPLMLFAGLALLQVTRNLSRRKALAWWVAVVALGVSLLTHIGHHLDLHNSLVAGLLLAYLVAFRHRFNARSDAASLRLGLALAAVVAGLVLAYGDIGLRWRAHEFSWPEGATPLGEAFRVGLLIVDPDLEPLTHAGARFLGSLEIAGWLGRLYVLVLLLRPVALHDRLEAPAGEVKRLFAAHGRRSLAAFAVQEDKHHLLVAGGRGLVAFAVRGPIALACGDPIAPDDAFEAAAGDFFAHARRNGWRGCIYEAAEDRLEAYERLGMRALKMAEEAVLELPAFSLAGGQRAGLRAMSHKATKQGLVVRHYDRAQDPQADLDEQLEEISEEWLAEKKLGELGFSLGRFNLESLDAAEVFVALLGERVVAFCTWLRYAGGTAAVLDLMRKRRDAVSGTMDRLLAESLLALKAAGLREASLANAPLANVGGPRTPLDRGVALLFERLNGIYGYKNLFQFKKKFAPRWEARYLVYPSGVDLPRVAYAMTDLHGSGGLRALLRLR